MMKCALYARYSTERQSRTSIEDQFRMCERIAEREGMTIAARFSDKEISGGTAKRPGYQALLSAARAGKFDVLISEDIDRLWRNRAEFGPRSAELEDLGVQWLSCVGDDTRREGWGLTIQIKAAMAEGERRKSSYRTKRGQEGKAMQGKPTGGKCYGYEPIMLSDGTKSRQIVPEHAKWVRWIFEQYAAVWSPRRIAAELNRREVPSPGSTWANRHERRRDGKWLASSINCGMLDNATYMGEVIWNKVTWVRSHADSSIRKPVPNPESEWIRRHIEELRIVPQSLWDRVRARRAARRAETSPRDCISKSGKVFVSRGGRPLKYPLSGLMKRGDCGSNFVVVDTYNYGCASHKEGGPHACANDGVVKRRLIVSELIDVMQTELFTPSRIALLRKEVARGLTAAGRDRESEVACHRKELAAAERVVDNIMAAIKQGIITPTTKRELQAAEAHRDALLRRRDSNVIPMRVLPDVVDRFEAKLDELPVTLAKDAETARGILASMMSSVKLVRRKEGLFLELGVDPARLLRVADIGGSGGRIPQLLACIPRLKRA